MTLISKKKTFTLFGVVLLFLSSFNFCFALKISPARIEIKGDPGQTISGEYLLVNEQNTVKTFYSSFENFEAQGDTGAPHFYISDDDLMSWIKSPSKIVLKPNEMRKISYSITIPEDVDSGGHFAAIFWGTTNPNEVEGEQKVMIGAKLGVLILLTVSGDVTEGGGVVDFATKEGKRFYTMLPVDIFYKFKNTGGDKIKPDGVVKIKNLFGITTNTLNANTTDGYTLPGSTRKYNVVWEGLDSVDTFPTESKIKEPNGFFETIKYQIKYFAFGLYNAKLDIAYGANNDLNSSSSFMFFVFPWELILSLLIGILVFWRGIKMYNAMIIKKAQSGIVQEKKNGSDVGQS